TQLPNGPANTLVQASYSPDGKHHVTVGFDSFARLWDGDRLEKLDHSKRVNLAVFSPDGKRIATASIDGTARLWTIHGELLKEIRWQDDPSSAAPQDSGKRPDPKSNPSSVILIPYAVFSPDSTMLLTVGDLTPRLWSAGDGSF